MKQIISALFLCMLLSGVPRLQAQNIQLHYDFGRSLYDKDLKGRPLLTSTVEKFHPDNWGSPYFFIIFPNGVIYMPSGHSSGICPPGQISPLFIPSVP